MPLKIGFLSAHDPFDRTAFSGTTYHAARALSRVSDVELTVLGPHRKQPEMMRRVRRKFGWDALSPAAFDLSGQDANIALVASGLIDQVQKPGLPPLYHVTDATPGFLAEFYGYDIGPDIFAREERVVQAARRVIYSSAYMADRAVSDFGLSEDDVGVVPFGINFEDPPADVPAKGPTTPLRLLYVGTKWERKGGDIALAAFNALRAKGHSVELTLVGEPPKGPVPDGVKVAGYLNKNKTDDAARLVALFKQAHVFLLPTRADCTPMVVGEANVFGMPVLITETGGIGSLIEQGTNGFMLPMTADGSDWADAVLNLLPNLEALGSASHAYAMANLTWDSWAERVVDILRRDLQKAPS